MPTPWKANSAWSYCITMCKNWGVHAIRIISAFAQRQHDDKCVSKSMTSIFLCAAPSPTNKVSCLHGMLVSASSKSTYTSVVCFNFINTSPKINLIGIGWNNSHFWPGIFDQEGLVPLALCENILIFNKLAQFLGRKLFLDALATPLKTAHWGPI